MNAITGLGDGPGCGLGVGSERLYHWVFGGPWSYGSPERGEPSAEDKAWLEGQMDASGAVITGRGTYEAAGHLGGKNPWGIPFFVVTHHSAEQPPGDDFVLAAIIIAAPVTLCAGKRPFDGFGGPLELWHLGVRQSPSRRSSAIASKSEGGES